MSFSRGVEQRGNRTVDVLTDDSAGTRIVVSRLGAELISMAKRDRNGGWLGFLYRDGELGPPASGWAKRKNCCDSGTNRSHVPAVLRVRPHWSESGFWKKQPFGCKAAPTVDCSRFCFDRSCNRAATEVERDA